MKKEPDKLTKTISTWNSSKQLDKIFRFMCHKSKNIYNTCIFHTQIYLQYSDKIFQKLYLLANNNKIKTIGDIDRFVYYFYDQFYQQYLIIKPFKQHNNNIIYQFIKTNLNENKMDLINDNFYQFELFICESLKKQAILQFPPNANIDVINELFYDIVRTIMKSIYNKNFNETARSMIHHHKCRIADETFINQVRDNVHLFGEEKKPKYKSLLNDHEVIKKFAEQLEKINAKKKANSGSKTDIKSSAKNKNQDKLTETKKQPKVGIIKSNQNYIGRIIYKYYKNPQIPSDIFSQIINKAHSAYSSFFELRKKNIKASMPKYLNKDGSYVLPYSIRSQKQVNINGNEYCRLTVGQTVADNFISIADDNRVVCIKNNVCNKLYIYKKHLIRIKRGQKIPKKDNYIWKNFYIPKNSEHIIEGYYVYVRIPRPIFGKKIKLIEVIPIYEGFRFKINFVYEDKKNDNNTDTKTNKKKEEKEKEISMDLGMVNLATIYDPSGEQYIISGKPIIAINEYYNKMISKARSLLAKHDPAKKNKQKLIRNKLKRDVKNAINGKFVSVSDNKSTIKRFLDQKKQMNSYSLGIINEKPKMENIVEKSSKKIRNLLIKRENRINGHMNKIVDWISKKYSDCKRIIVGYNEGWKQGVNMRKDNNRKFYDIPFRKLLSKLRDKLEKNNQILEITEESYTSKCDALALEEIKFHETYLGKRTKRGLFSSSAGKLINADLNGAINIMRKWKEKNGEIMNKIKGKNLCNPAKVNYYPRSKRQRRMT